MLQYLRLLLRTCRNRPNTANLPPETSLNHEPAIKHNKRTVTFLGCACRLSHTHKTHTQARTTPPTGPRPELPSRPRPQPDRPASRPPSARWRPSPACRCCPAAAPPSWRKHRRPRCRPRGWPARTGTACCESKITEGCRRRRGVLIIMLLELLFGDLWIKTVPRKNGATFIQDMQKIARGLFPRQEVRRLPSCYWESGSVKHFPHKNTATTNHRREQLERHRKHENNHNNNNNNKAAFFSTRRDGAHSVSRS